MNASYCVGSLSLPVFVYYIGVPGCLPTPPILFSAMPQAEKTKLSSDLGVPKGCLLILLSPKNMGLLLNAYVSSTVSETLQGFSEMLSTSCYSYCDTQRSPTISKTMVAMGTTRINVRLFCSKPFIFYEKCFLRDFAHKLMWSSANQC